MIAAEGRQLLEQVRGERGYVLSYHEILARSDPALLRAYRELYAEFTLQPRHLDTRRRELVWTGLLASIDEHVGTIHLERALAAGVEREELRAAVRVGAVAATWDAMAFGAQHWPSLLGEVSAEQEYRTVIEGAREPLAEAEAHLILSLVAGARSNAEQFLFHLTELYRFEVPEAEVIEAVSYLLLPVGANTLLWATDHWLDAIRTGRLTAGAVLEDVSFDVRRA